MANNIVLNAGSGGSTLATEQNGAAEQYQKIKITDGTAAGFTNMAAVTSGGALKTDSSGAVQPINDNAGSLTVDNAGTSFTDTYSTSHDGTNSNNFASDAGSHSYRTTSCASQSGLGNRWTFNATNGGTDGYTDVIASYNASGGGGGAQYYPFLSLLGVG